MAMQPGDNNLPRPYLNREETDKRLAILGFHFPPLEGDGDAQVARFVALQELIAGAIAEWEDVKDDFEDESPPEAINEELNDWAQEWLVG